MAPEQAKTGDVTPASDIFSLGVLLYFAATSKLPFGEGGTAEVLFRVVYEEPDVSGLTDIEPQLRDLILRCMAKDPLQRPNAAGVVALSQTAAGTGAWSPGNAVQWPEPLAAQIHERTLAAGRTLPDPSLADSPQMPDPSFLDPPQYARQQQHAGQQQYAGQQQSAQQMYSAPPPILPPVDSERTVSSTGPADPRWSGTGTESRKRHGVLIATISTVAVLALGVTGYLMLQPSSGSAADAASTHSTGSALGGSASATVASDQSPRSSGSASSSSSSSTSTSASASRSASSSSSASPTGAATSAGGGATQQTSAATTTSAAAPATTSTSSAGSGSSGTSNKYTAAQVCGSGYQSVASHGITGATIYLFYSNSARENCVVTLATTVSGKVSMSATLQVQGGNTGGDSGSYTYYAEPVKEAAAGKCVIYGGGYNGQSWSSNSWNYCGS